MPDLLVLRLAGGPVLHVNGRDCALDGLAAVLAARLAIEGPQPRALLAALLWPDADPSRARANLRQRLLRVKQQAGLEWIIGDSTLALSPTVQVEATDDSSAAELLQGVSLIGQDELSQWLDMARDQQRQRRLTALSAAAHVAETELRWDDAIAFVQRQLAIDPMSEARHRALIRLHYLAHDAGRARAVFDNLKAMLQREFGTGPGPDTLALMQLVQQSATEPALALTVAKRAQVALQRPPRLVGRRHELATLRAAIAQQQPLLLLGEAGMGKSRLLVEALQGAPAALLVKAQAGDAGVPYSTLARLLRRVWERQRQRPAGGALASLLPEMGPALPLPADGDRLALQAAVQLFLAGSDLQVVAVDDLHFADAATLEMLAALVTDDALTLAWLFTQRPGEGSAAALALREALEDAGRLSALAVAPLNVDQVRELLHDLQLPGLDADRVAMPLHRHTGGNPLFVLETLKSMPMGQGGMPSLPQPSTVTALIDRRLRRLSPQALALARVAAIAGADFDPELAEAVTGRKAVELADAWAELEAAQVLRDCTFAHDLVLEATARSVPPAIAARLHAAVAQHLHTHTARAGRAARLAAHWQAAGDGKAALPCLLQAADEARDALRRREEAEFVEQAAQWVQELCPPEGPAAVDLWLRAYHARECVGGIPAALPALDRALQAATDPRERMMVQIVRAAAAIDACDYEQGLRIGMPALQQALQLGDDDRAANILTKLSSALSMTGHGAEAAALLEQHWPVVERLKHPSAANHIERALLLDNLGRPHEARPFHRQGMAIAQDRGQHSELVIGTLNLAVSLLDTGEAAAALTELQAAERLRLSHDALQGANVIGWNLLALAERDLAHPTAALQWFERQLALDAEQLPARAPLDRLNRAWLWVQLGQTARAMQDLADDGAYEGLPAWVTVRAWHLRVRLAAQRGAVGESLVQQARKRLERCDVRVVKDALRIELALAEASHVDADGTARAADTLDGLRQAALSDGYHGLFWAATWAAAHCAALQGRAEQARQLVRQAMSRPTHLVPTDLWPGSWWHGLWRVCSAVGDGDAAQAARAEGVAWVHRLLFNDLPPEFHPAFRETVAAHRELLGSRSHV